MPVSLESASKFKQQAERHPFQQLVLDVSATGQSTIQAILVRRVRYLSSQSKDDKRLR